MNKLIQGVLVFKTFLCLMFSASIIGFWFIGAINGWDALPLGLILQCFLMSVFITAVQGLIFTDLIFKKLSYPLRLIVFMMLLFVGTAILAFVWNWFPMEELSYWLTFGGIFLLVFIGMTVGFEVYFRITGNRYDQLLREKQGK